LPVDLANSPPQDDSEPWIDGPLLPDEAFFVGAKAIQYDSTFLLIGNSPDIYKFNAEFSDDDDAWSMLSQKIQEPREVYDAFLAPDTAVRCAFGG